MDETTAHDCIRDEGKEMRPLKRSALISPVTNGHWYTQWVEIPVGGGREPLRSIVCRPLAAGLSRKTGRPMAIGTTSEGLLAVVVYELIDDVTVYVITAFEVNS